MNLSAMARQFLLKWSFLQVQQQQHQQPNWKINGWWIFELILNYFIHFQCSMVIGDLTLRRSAASFGSFHLIRLLYDGEYIFYLVEHRVAMVTGEFVNMTLRPKDEDEAGSDVCASVPYSGSSASLLRCLPSLNRRLATTAVNNICSTRWPTAVRPTTSNVPNWVDFDTSTTN